MASVDPNLGHERPQVFNEFLSDLKSKFPEISEQLILDQIAKFDGDIEKVTTELNKKTNKYMYGENSRDIFQNIHPVANKYSTNNMTSSSDTSLDTSGSEQTTMQNASSYGRASSSSIDLQRDLPEPPLLIDSNKYENNLDSTKVQMNMHSSIFLERRTISDDSLSRRRPISDIRRERSTSDISDLTNNTKNGYPRNVFLVPSKQNNSQEWRSPPHVPIAKTDQLDWAIEKEGKENQLQEKNRLSQNIQLQLDSCTRMQTKVNALRADVDKIRLQVMQEEDDINASSKVQKNPTEKDVLKLKGEIQILQIELMEALTALEKIKACGTDKQVPSQSIQASLQRMNQEELRSSIQPPIRSSEAPVPHPHMSASRFPHPNYTSQTFIPVSGSLSSDIGFNPPRIDTPPPDYSTLVNPIPEISDDQWQCRDCTFQNHAELLECELCCHPR